MRRTLRVLVLAGLCCLPLSGCQSTEWAGASLEAWRLIEEEYKGYIEADAALTPESKAIRTETADRLTDLLETAAGKD